MQFFSRFVLRRAGWVAFIGTALAFVGAYYSVQLYKNLRTDFRELLPTNARSVTDLSEVTQRLNSIDNLGILIFSKHTAESRRFVVDLAERLNKGPKELVASVEYKIDKELRFFKARQALSMDATDLVKVRDYIHERIEYEKELYNPLNIVQEEELPEPRFDFQALKLKYSKKTSLYESFPGGFYATPDETKREILVYVAGSGSDIDHSHEFKNFVEKTIADLKPTSYASDLEVKFTGSVQDAIEEHGALIADLELSTLIVVVVVTLAMLLYYGAIRATVALILSLFMGTFWTFGVSYFVVGYLNANSAFLGSIVIGNGINFGIIFLARYLEERRKRRGNARAIQLSMRQTATATWTAALAAALSYGSLMLTDFRGFRQFGVIGLIGMVLCWLSAFTLMPAYLTLLDKMHTLARPNRKPPRAFIAGALARMIDRSPGVIWGFSLIMTLMALATSYRYTPKILETNLGSLRNRESLEHGSAYLSKYQDEIFQHYLSPIVLLPKTREDAQKIAAVLEEKIKKDGKRSLLASVQTLDDFIPKDQDGKIRILREIRKLLPPRFVARLSESDQRMVREFLQEGAFKKVTMEDLPELVRNKFTEKNGTLGNLVLVEPPLLGVTWEGDRLIQLIDELREAADSVVPGTPVAGTLPIAADMIRAVSHDGPRATMFAFLAVVILVVFLFRNVQTISLVLFSLMLGVVWLAGIILGFWVKINFLNFIALPITFGIGIDYGVNIFQRYREEGGGNILNVIRSTGGAVLLCSFTTITGYSSLLIASNKGFVSFGLLAVAGELTCVIAAVVALPAFLLLRHRRKSSNTVL
ncbi:MMPL family transporter [Bdellovibrionota bacterium FG-1]